MQNAGLDKAHVGIEIARISINNIRYADYTILMAESDLLQHFFISSISSGFFLRISVSLLVLSICFYILSTLSIRALSISITAVLNSQSGNSNISVISGSDTSFSSNCVCPLLVCLMIFSFFFCCVFFFFFFLIAGYAVPGKRNRCK